MFHQQKMIGENLRKIMQQLLLIFFMPKQKKIIVLMFQTITQIMKKQVILLMIPNEENWHYLVVKKLLALLRGITSKHYGDFYCLSCLHSFGTNNKLESHKKVCKNKNFCNVIILSEDTKILEFNQYQKHHLLFIQILNV